MNTTISFNVRGEEAVRTRQLAHLRGFATISDYLRFLLQQDDSQLISEDELVKRATEIPRLAKRRTLVRARSMAALRKEI